MLADDVLAAADAAGFDRFSVAGVSLGGMVGMELALRTPERVEKLLPICTSATMDSASWNDRIAKVRGEGMAAIADLAMGRFLSDAAEPAIYEAVRRQLLAMDAQGYAGCGAAIRDMGLADRIGGIACPTLVITGTRDTSTPYEGHGEHLIARIAEAGARNAFFIPVRLPHEVAPLFRAWLDEHFPDRAGKVMATIRSLRGGRDNDPDFFTRMKGSGPWADLLRTRFQIACRKHGLNRTRIALRTDLFRAPRGPQGELF